MRAAFYTLGCKVNQYETVAMEEQFVRDGFEIVDSNDNAEVYVLNSCTVTSESDRKARQLLRRFRRTNPTAVVALCGCFPQAFPNVATEIPEADIILGSSNKKSLLGAVKERLAGGERVIDIKDYTKNEEFEKTSVSNFGAKTRAFVKIEDGCERFCAYCIIPHARGPVRSKPLDDLINEIQELASSGYKEIVLVGINLSCYGLDLGLKLIDAIGAVCNVEGIERVRLGSLEPELLNNETISKMGTLSKLCPQFHLSLQSGSDATLKRMRRHYDTAEYRRIVKSLRETFSNCAITTDIMVGFPGETEEEFKESLAFAEEIGLARAHIFAYSRRAGTSADRMPNQVTQVEKSRRSKEMEAATNATRKAFLESQLGRIEPVLFETTQLKGRREGYTPNYTTVRIESDEDLSRKILNVKLLSIENDEIIGEIIQSDN